MDSGLDDLSTFSNRQFIALQVITIGSRVMRSTASWLVVSSVFALIGSSTLCVSPAWTQSPPPLLEVRLATEVHTGLPIHWDNDFAMLLQPSGAMQELQMSDVRGHRVLSESFVPQSLTSARSMLQAEFGSNYETATVGPYVLCALKGHSDRWKERFRVLLAGYRRYFETRGWQLRNPDFPLCVIILPSKADFEKYCQQQLNKTIPNLMGYYFPKNNRCVLFEVNSPGAPTDWSETERTIVHEAVHQLAYNTGIHERIADNPQWVVEGLATMFEEPTVFDPRYGSRAVEARINMQQLLMLKGMMADSSRFESRLTQLVSSNKSFQQNAQEAYALAWGLTFYLSERMPIQYGTYLQKMAKLNKLQTYDESLRYQDFQRVMESDTRMLALQMQRFYGSLTSGETK